MCAVEFDAVALRPTYRLLWGAIGQSNALDIAAGLGVPKSMLAAARRIMQEELSASSTDARSGALMVRASLLHPAQTFSPPRLLRSVLAARRRVSQHRMCVQLDER